MYENTVISEIRLLPMGKIEFETMDEVQSFFATTLVNRNGRYNYREHGMNCNPNTLVLFQYDGVLVASAIMLERKVESNPPYKGYFLFDTTSIVRFQTPITLEQIQEIDSHIHSFNMAPQTIDYRGLSKIRTLISVVSSDDHSGFIHFNKERLYECFRAFRVYIEANSKSKTVELSSNTFFVEQEGYKSDIFEKANAALRYNTWKPSLIGTNQIAILARMAVNCSENLVHYQQKTHFFNMLDEHPAQAEQVLYDIYCGNDDERAFDNAVAFFGGKYDLLAFLFFIKNKEKYLPIRSTMFDKCFEYLGVPFSTSYKCSAANYFQFVDIISRLRAEMINYFGCMFTLLDAHSVVWQIELAKQYAERYVDEAEDLQLIGDINQIGVEDTGLIDENIGDPREKDTPMITSGHKVYPRNRQIARVALQLAHHCCENDPSHESFIRRNSTQKYMEPHHLIPLSESDRFEWSLDVPANIVSLCSNCHNEIHYGENAREIIEKLYYLRIDVLKEAKIEVALDDLLEMYGF